MAITHRRGAYGNFSPDKMLTGEIAVVVSGDPNTDNGKAFYMCFEPGEVKRVMTYDDLVTEIKNATADILVTVYDARDRAETAAEAAEAITKAAEEVYNQIAELYEKFKNTNVGTLTAQVEDLETKTTALQTDLDTKTTTLQTSIDTKATTLQTNIDATNLLISGTAITSGADLNNYTTPGNYYCNTTTICNSLTNCPVTTRVFSLEVLASSSTNSRRVQKLTAHYTSNSSVYGAGKPVIWERSKYSASAWSEWVQIMTSDDLEIYPQISDSSNGRTIKFENGIMIATQTVTQTVNITNAWGSLYNSTSVISFPDYPASFTEVWSRNVSPEGGGDYVFWVVQEFISTTGKAPSLTNVGSYRVVRTSSASSQSVTLTSFTIGKWK